MSDSVADGIARRRAEESDATPVDFLSQIVSPEQLAKVREPEKPLPRERRPGEMILDYPERPELAGDFRPHDGPAPSQGTAMERPATLRGEAPTLDTSKERPELEGKSVIDRLRERNSRTLADLRRDYLLAWDQYRSGNSASRPAWSPQLASDYSAELKRVGPSAGDPPAVDLVSPRESV